MNLRLCFMTIVCSLAVASLGALVGCTDTPGFGAGEECPDGQQFDEQLEECVEAPDQDAGVPDAGENQNVTTNDNIGEPGDNHPHAGRDDLEPYEDEAGDGVPNRYDNCPYEYNPDQTDTAGDGIGDACDNCPHLANPAQVAHDDNPYWDPHPHNEEAQIRKGDACCTDPQRCGGDDTTAPSAYADIETDTSGDGVPDIMDNCPDVYNPPTDPDCVAANCGDDPHCQECICSCENDYPCEGDEVVQDDFDRCEQPDSSGDGVGDMCDNCPGEHNPNQTAADSNPYWDPHPYINDQIRKGDACAPEPAPELELCETEATEFERMKPNVYISFDLSGSMGWSAPSGNSRMSEALDGLDAIADQLHDDIRFGLGTFPDDSGGSCTYSHELDIGEHSASTLKSTWNAYSPSGATPMEASLNDILENDRVSDPNDPSDDQRIKAVLLVTDGVANCTSGNSVQGVVDTIEELYHEDILTFVVGFDLDDPSLEAYAQAGGTGEHFLADNADELADAMQEVADLLISCDYHVDPGGDVDPDQTWINVDGDYLSPDDYSYNPSDNVVTIDEDACEDLRDIDTEEMEVEIEMGCATECQPEEPQGYCDLYYETCGEDYPCDSCSWEVCDGQDNNCSGTIDDNCPACGIYQAECDDDTDCCEPFICNNEGLCDHDCYPLGAPCSEPDDCCTGLCAIDSGDDFGECVTG